MTFKLNPSLTAPPVFAPGRLALALLALALVSSPAGATTRSLRDFQLPPAPEAAPQVQGPTDTEAAIPVAPRVIPTSTPSPLPTSAPAPSAGQTPPETQPAPSQIDQRQRFTPAARRNPRQQARELNSPAPASNPVRPDSQSLPNSRAPNILTDPGDFSAAPGFSATSGGLGNAGSGEFGKSEQGQWGMGLWLAPAAGFVAALAGLLIFWSRRRKTAPMAAPIEPPLVQRAPKTPANPASPVNPAPPIHPANPASGKPNKTRPEKLPPATPAPETPIGAAPAPPITLALSPIRLSRSVMNANLACTITVSNQGTQDFSDLMFAGDMQTAHGKVAIGEQVADAASALPQFGKLAALPSGESREINASFMLPLAQIRPITQGRAQLYVPLLRLRVSGDGLAPISQTFVIGQIQNGGDLSAGSNSKVQPFRLDEMPQTYTQIGCRALG